MFFCFCDGDAGELTEGEAGDDCAEHVHLLQDAGHRSHHLRQHLQGPGRQRQLALWPADGHLFEGRQHRPGLLLSSGLWAYNGWNNLNYVTEDNQPKEEPSDTFWNEFHKDCCTYNVVCKKRCDFFPRIFTTL